MGIEVLKNRRYYKEVILQQYKSIKTLLTIKSKIGLSKNIKAPLTIKSKIGLNRGIAQVVIEEASITVFR